VKPEGALFVEKARQQSQTANIMLGAGLNEEAGRTAYLARFHAAQAFIFEYGGKALNAP
jgi:uncharacterized protein (UPF0332 family)